VTLNRFVEIMAIDKTLAAGEIISDQKEKFSVPTTTRSFDEVGAAVARALARLSISDLGELYDEEIAIWHNHDRMTQSRAENLKFLGELFKLFKHLKYSEIERQITPTGYVQQHVLLGELNDGRVFALPCCHVVRIRNGKITRFDEYFDPAPLYAALGNAPEIPFQAAMTNP